MITLYTYPTGNGLRASIALEEAGIDWQPAIVNLRSGEQKSERFLTINPDGLIPVLHEASTGDEKPFILRQSTAIMTYAAEKTGRLLPLDRAARANVFEALHWVTSDIVAPWNMAFLLGDAPEHSTAKEFLEERALTKLNGLEHRLKKTAFVSGDDFSLADCAAFPFVRALHQQSRLGDLPKTFAWFEAISARPAIQRGIAKGSGELKN